MNRWCIIAGPRTGSHYLEDLIFNNLPQTNELPAVKLGEFLHEKFVTYIDSTGNEQYLEYHINTDERKNYINGILSSIELCKNQSFVFRIFFIPFLFDEKKIDIKFAVELLEKINENGFKFIFLQRNIFDQTISLSVAQQTMLWIKYKTKNNDILYNEDRKNTQNHIHILDSKFMKNLQYLNSQKLLTKKIIELSKISYIGISYENLIEDCKKNLVPISNESRFLKTYEMSYEKKISNFENLKKMYQGI